LNSSTLSMKLLSTTTVWPNPAVPDNTHNTHKRQASRLLAGFEPAIPTNELPQTQALPLATALISQVCYNRYISVEHFLILLSNTERMWHICLGYGYFRNIFV
jgi:hypothetical protein